MENRIINEIKEELIKLNELLKDEELENIKKFIKEKITGYKNKYLNNNTGDFKGTLLEFIVRSHKKSEIVDFLKKEEFISSEDIKIEIIKNEELRKEVLENNIFDLLELWIKDESFNIEILGDKINNYLVFLVESKKIEILKELSERVPLKSIIYGTKTLLDIIIESSLESKDKKDLMILYREKGALTSYELILLESDENKSFLKNEKSLLEKKINEIMKEHKLDYNKIFDLVFTLLLSKNSDNLKKFLEVYNDEYSENLMTVSVSEVEFGYGFVPKTIKYNFFDFLFVGHKRDIFSQLYKNEKGHIYTLIELYFKNTNYNFEYILNFELLTFLLNEVYNISKEAILRLRKFIDFNYNGLNNYLDKFDIFTLLEEYYLVSDDFLNNDFFYKYLIEKIKLTLSSKEFKYSYIYEGSFLEFKIVSLYTFLNNGIINEKYYKKRAKKILDLLTECVENLEKDEFKTLLSIKDSLGRTLLHELFIFNDERLINVLIEKLEINEDNYSIILIKDEFGNTPLDYIDIFRIVISDVVIKKIHENYKNKLNNKAYSFYFYVSILDTILSYTSAVTNKTINVKNYSQDDLSIVPSTNVYELFKNKLTELKIDEKFTKKGLTSYKTIAEITDNINSIEERSLKKFLQDTFGDESKKTLVMLERLGYSIVKNKNKSKLIIENIKRNISLFTEETISDIKNFIVETLYISLNKALYIDLEKKIKIEKIETLEEIQHEIDLLEKLMIKNKDDKDKMMRYSSTLYKKNQRRKKIEEIIDSVKPLSFIEFKNQFKLIDNYIRNLGSKGIDTEFFNRLKRITIALYGEDIVELYTNLAELNCSKNTFITASDEKIFSFISKEIKKYEMCKLDRGNKIAIIPDILEEKYLYFLTGKGYATEIYNTNLRTKLFDF